MLRKAFAEISEGTQDLKKKAEIVDKAREICQFVDERVKDLDKQRAAFILNKYQELSYGEVAEVMIVDEHGRVELTPAMARRVRFVERPLAVRTVSLT